MGLDAVEIVMDLEERFGITIRSEELAGVRTVGDVIDLVMERYRALESNECHTQRAFYQVRRDVCLLAGDNMLRPRPGDRIADWVPRHQRRKFWSLLAERLGHPPPPLVLPRHTRYAALGISVRLLVLAVAAGLWNAGWFPLPQVLCVLLAISLWWLVRPLAIVPPPQLSTLADAARRIAGTQIAFHDDPHRHPDVWVPDAVCEVIANVLGIERVRVVPAALLVEDLGMN